MLIMIGMKVGWMIWGDMGRARIIGVYKKLIEASSNIKLLRESLVIIN